MSILDKKHILTINLDKSSIEFDGNIRFYNTDKNIANLFVKIKKKNSDGADTFLNQSELEGVVLKLTARKPKTNQTREMTGILTEELIDQSCAIYKFELSQEFTDQVGSVVCEFELSNANGEKVTIDSFSYIIKASELTGLNAEIESNPDLPVLKALIEEVKETAQTVNNIDDVNITETKTFSNKKIDEKFSTVSSQIKEIAKDVLLEDGKLYLKKSDGTKLGTGVVLPLSGSGGSVTWESLTGKPTTFTPSSHSHSKSDITDFPTIPTKTSELNNDSGFLTSHQDLSNYVQKESGKGLSTNDLTTTLKQNYDNAYTHSQSTHAPANAQKNSDITKEEIEAKLTGEISTHSHANGSSIKNEWVTLINKKISVESVNSILENFILDGNYNYFKIYITRTSNESNTVSSLSLKQIIINGINCGSFTINFGNPQTENKEIFVNVHKLNNLIDWSYRVATNSLEYNQSNMTYGLSRVGINSSYLNKLYVAFNDIYTGDINIIVEGGVV